MRDAGLTTNVSIILVFAEGFISFFSPCVLPLIPVYISYLAGNGRKVNSDGTITYERKRVLFNTLFFILGISSVFFILGLSFSTLGIFFNKNRELFSRIGGIIIIVMGLVQLNIIKLNFLKMEKRINLNIGGKVNPVLAYIMGFTFSFAWTPCVGPALASVLILASNAENTFTGNMLVLVYALGFIIPFIILGIFTTETLNFFKEKRELVKYTIKIGGVILIIIGIITFTGAFTTISRSLSF
ncbi:MAG: cytochrome c biogenesis CcdA family protein [Tissierellia bacterium]|nr:cytochrome c biogenesis CcdA family protein [Tissierellia bacterium]MDD3225996.1 cytochrome c biogenesis CcdA family protein [Tissierellia bacterium]MDD3750489.1 cytochrome c biogenesis CcdA family protein [Tissierellia bacterium]MDD4046411.1 cytochrome c biogenesis CcdA family protein [Tissierellia bacterium]MDD4677846.1 cytochrome c biogenesis CcdA family protein [Tissierellia bacterium]